MDQISSRCDALCQTDRFDEMEELHRKNNEYINRITYLSKTVEQKDDMVKLLLKEKNILECEKDLLQKEQQSAVKDKECIVMSFAIVEKKLIDLKTQLEQAEKREKKLTKEFDTLNNKLKAAEDEKRRITATLDEKDFQENLENNGAEESADKIAELKATQIMLAHVNTEQANKIHHLEKQLENENKELQAAKTLLANRDQEQACMRAEKDKLHQENLDLQNLVDVNVMKVAELLAKVNDLEALSAQLSISNNLNCNLTENLQHVQKQLAETRDEMTKIQTRESELLALNQELCSLNAMLQNEMSLQGSKSLATSLEDHNVDKTQYEMQLKKLQDELDSERKDRFEERCLMARHFAEKSKEADNLQQKLDQALEDLTVTKKKHIMSIKDLQREIASLQKLASNETQKGEQEKSCLRNKDSVVDVYEEKEPTTSKLIERIVRLQQANNRQAEKIEFLENHSSTLVVELQKKAKIVSHYMMKEQSNSVSSGEKNKLYSGIINAVYGNVKTSEISLELVLEVNKKLQLVLEDTLLKNITLKDNLDTLGLEVDRLTRQIAIYKRGKQ